MGKVRAQCRKTGTHIPLDVLLITLNQMFAAGAPTFDRECPAQPSST